LAVNSDILNSKREKELIDKLIKLKREEK